jgi:hypothetical protein
MRIGGWRVGFAVSGLLGLAVVCASHEAGGAGAQQQHRWKDQTCSGLIARRATGKMERETGRRLQH